MRLPPTPEEGLANWSLGIALVCLFFMILFAMTEPVEGQDLTSFMPYPEAFAFNSATAASDSLDAYADLVEQESENAGKTLGNAKALAMLATWGTAVACREHEPSIYLLMFDLGDLDRALLDLARSTGSEESFLLAKRFLAREARRLARDFRFDAERVVRECETP